MLHQISLKNPDIIISGKQSGTVPKYMFNLSYYNIKSIEYFLELNPDIVVFCVNTYDEIEYIKRSILAIENLIECKVIAVAVLPLTFKSSWNQMNNKKDPVSAEDMKSFRNEIEENLFLPTYIS